MYRLPFSVTLLQSEATYYAVINKGFVHSCTQLDSHTGDKFNKDITYENFELLDVSAGKNKIIVTIHLLDSNEEEKFKCEISGVNIDAMEEDIGAYENVSNPNEKKIKIAEIDFSGPIPTVNQIIQSDIWICRDAAPPGSDSSSDDSDDYSSSESDSESDSDSSDSSDSDNEENSSGSEDSDSESGSDSNYDSDYGSDDLASDDGSTSDGGESGSSSESPPIM